MFFDLVLIQELQRIEAKYQKPALQRDESERNESSALVD
jgi:hypothetical protein